MRLTIERLVPGGLGLARLPDGRVVLLGGGLPGEVVEATVREAPGRLASKVSAVLEPSPDRVAPPPGAPPTVDLGHARYEAQLAYKRGFVEDALRRIGKLEADVAPTRPSPREWRYRTAAQYLVTPSGVAYRERASHEPVPIGDDPLVAGIIAGGLPDLEPERLTPATEIAFRGSLDTGEVLAALVGPGGTGEYRRAAYHLRALGVAGVSLASPSSEGRFRAGVRHLWGETALLERYGDHSLSVTATGFAQVNPPAAGELYRRAAELAGRGDRALDLYGGAGPLAFHLAKRFDEVGVLEISAEAVARGEADAQRLGVTNVDFIRDDASRLRGLRPEVVTLDPPRAGLSPEALAALLEARPERIVYVSCDPATWARDAGRLARGGYRLAAVEPWDFYPQTSHVEVLSLLERA